jgi:hypothetical protein
MSGLKSTKKPEETQVYTENDYTLGPFEIDPNHDIWLAVNAIRYLVSAGYYDQHKDMTWRLNDIATRLEESMNE